MDLGGNAMAILGGILLLLGLLELASLLFVPCLLGAFYLKYYLSRRSGSSISRRSATAAIWSAFMSSA